MKIIVDNLDYNQESKACPNCKCEKDINEFSKNKSQKDGLSRICKTCNSFYNRMWRDSNLDKHRANSRAWAKANPDRCKANKKANHDANIDRSRNYEKTYRDTNKDKIKIGMKEYYKSNSEKYKAIRREYYKANTDKVKAANKAWQIANPEKYHLIKSRQRAIKSNQTHPNHDLEIERELIIKSREMHKKHGIKQHIDHIWPLSKGGPHHHDNLQVISETLNTQKRNSVLFSHQDIKTWVDLPLHILQWIKINKKEKFDGVLEEVIRSGKYSPKNIERLTSMTT